MKTIERRLSRPLQRRVRGVVATEKGNSDEITDANGV